MEALSRNISCVNMHLFCNPHEGCGFHTDKVGRQFSGSTASKRQTFHSQGQWPCWQSEGFLDEDTVLIRGIPEQIIESSYTI
jgi:hypothetical protein